MNLPNDLVRLVLAYLDAKSLMQLLGVSRAWRGLGDACTREYEAAVCRMPWHTLLSCFACPRALRAVHAVLTPSCPAPLPDEDFCRVIGFLKANPAMRGARIHARTPAQTRAALLAFAPELHVGVVIWHRVNALPPVMMPCLAIPFTPTRLCFATNLAGPGAEVSVNQDSPYEELVKFATNQSCNVTVAWR